MVHSNGYHICFSSYISITMFQNYQTFAQCLVQKPQFRHTKIITMSLQSLQSYFICQKKLDTIVNMVMLCSMEVINTFICHANAKILTLVTSAFV